MDTMVVAKDLKQKLERAQSFKDYMSKYFARIAHPSVDKYNLKFHKGLVDRHSVVSIPAGSLNAYTGTYGNSSCSTFDTLSQKDVDAYWYRAIEVHANAILNTIGDMLEEEAKRDINKLEEEVRIAQEVLNNLNVQE